MPSVDILPFARGRIFSVSSAAPFAAVLSQDRRFIDSTKQLVSFFEHVDAKLKTEIRRNRESPKEGKSKMRVCNTASTSWKSASVQYMRHHGWPVLRGGVEVTRACISDVFGVKDMDWQRKMTDGVVEDLVVQRATSMRQHAREMMKQSVRNWSAIEVAMNFPFYRGSQICLLNNAVGFRIRGKWYTATQITNHAKSNWVRDGDRIYVTENMRVEDGKLVSARMTLPINPGVGEVHNVSTLATTVISKWAGAAEPSMFRPMIIERNTAILDAMEKAGHEVQQMEDATSASNLAILAFPLFLNVVPIALVANVSRMRMVLYVIASDILTALPMLIKGVEIVLIAGREFQSAMTRMGDPTRDGSETSVAAEVWVASCQTRRGVRGVGVTLICVSLGLMVLGVVLEFVARWYMGHRKVVRRRRGFGREVRVVDGVGVAGCGCAEGADPWSGRTSVDEEWWVEFERTIAAEEGAARARVAHGRDVEGDPADANGGGGGGLVRE